MESRPALQVVLLGPIGVRSPDGGIAEPPGDRARRLLAWLALPPHPEKFHARETLGEQLWPRKGRKQVQDSMSQALGQLRTFLEELNAEDHLRIAGQRRSLVGLFNIESDLAQFRASRDRDDLPRAIERVTGRPLENLGRLTGFWAEATQATLVDEVDDVLASYTSRLEEAGDHTQALVLHERRLDLDPYSQDAIRGLMRCHAALNRPKVALALLNQHLGSLLPETLLDTETLELKQAIEGSIPGRAEPYQPHPGPRYGPTHTYPGTRDFDPSFNSDLMRDLANSRSYIFRGISAKYVPGRVRLRGPGLDMVRIMTLDIEAEEAIRMRAIDRSHNPKYQGRSLEELQKDLQHEIAVALVALFDCRHLCTIDIGCVASTAVDRVELFDDALYVSLYHGPRAEGFPETMRYTRDSVAYGQQRLDCTREFELARRRLQFRAEQSADDLPQLLADAGIALSGDQIPTYRSEGEAFTASFMDRLNTLED